MKPNDSRDCREGEPSAPPAPSKCRRDFFSHFAAWTTRASGSKWAFLIALGTIIVWAVTGPFFHFSNLWQLVINTATTIVTFLMVFLIQNAQNRESKAVHLKLDELILAAKRANNEMIEIETLSDDQLDQIATRYRKVAERYHAKLEARLEGMTHAVSQEGSHLKREVAGTERDVQGVEKRVSRLERKIEAPQGSGRRDR